MRDILTDEERRRSGKYGRQIHGLFDGRGTRSVIQSTKARKKLQKVWEKDPVFSKSLKRR